MVEEGMPARRFIVTDLIVALQRRDDIKNV